MKKPSKKQLSVIKAGRFDTISVGEKIAKESAVLVLHIGQPGFVRRLNSRSLLADAGLEESVDSNLIYVSQDIIDRSELKALSKHRSQFVSFVKTLCVPSPLLANGLYLLPLTLVEMMDEKVREFIEGREHLIDEFETNYEEIKQKAKIKRGKFFSESDYPPFEQIRAQYTVEAKFLSFNVPAALEKINKEIHDRMKQQVELEWQETSLNVREAVRQGFHELTTHFSDRLGVDEQTGKPLKFHEARINNLVRFLETFEARDMTNDTELQELAKKARELVQGVKVEDIRTDVALRDALKANFDKIKIASEKLLVSRGRKFKLNGKEGTNEK